MAATSSAAASSEIASSSGFRWRRSASLLQNASVLTGVPESPQATSPRARTMAEPRAAAAWRMAEIQAAPTVDGERGQLLRPQDFGSGHPRRRPGRHDGGERAGEQAARDHAGQRNHGHDVLGHEILTGAAFTTPSSARRRSAASAGSTQLAAATSHAAVAKASKPFVAATNRSYTLSTRRAAANDATTAPASSPRQRPEQQPRQPVAPGVGTKPEGDGAPSNAASSEHEVS